MRTIILFLTVSSFTAGCIKEIPLNLEGDTEDLLINIPAITALINLEKKDTVYLDYTYGINNVVDHSTNTSTIIEISNNNDNSLGFLNRLNNGRYLIPNNIKLSTNETYNLKVFQNDNTVIAATFTIPPKVTPKDIFTVYIPSPSGNDTRSFEFVFKDDESLKNFYEVAFLSVSYYKTRDTSSINIMSFPSIPDLVLDNEGDLGNEPSTFVFSDDLFNGETYHFNITMENTAGDLKEVNGKFMNGSGRYLAFRTISEDYYLFKKSLAKHRANQVIASYAINDIDLSIIFPGEPSELYTNVNGGYGIVAGYQEVIIPFKEK